MTDTSFWLLPVLAILCASCTGSIEQSAQTAMQEEWVSLFDGQTLEGWTPKIRGEAFGKDTRNTFRVEDGAISVSYDAYQGFDEDFGHLFYDTPHAFYRLRFSYRFMGEQTEGGPGWAWRNSGIMIHSPPGSAMGLDQDFPVSIEVQLLGGNGEDERSTANLCTPGSHVVMDGALETRHCISSSSPTYHGDDWVEADILVLGDSLISHYVEGEVVLSYTDPQMGGGNVSGHDPALLKEGQPMTSGYFSLQSESHPVQFRNIELLSLQGCMDPDNPAFKSYYVAHEEALCL